MNRDASSNEDPLREEDASKPSAAKLSALEGVLSRIERNYGRGSIVKLGEAERMVVDCIGSGSLTLGEFRRVRCLDGEPDFCLFVCMFVIFVVFWWLFCALL